MAKEIFDIIQDMRKQDRPFAVATVIETTGSSSAKTSSKVVIDEEGNVVAGWVGGGCAESATCTEALECIKTGETTVLELDLDDEMLGTGMPCGGSMRIYVEPILPKPALNSEGGYIALIASRKRSRLVLDYLREEGISEEALHRVVAPSGLDLGARTPEEIALCVMSEIVLTRRGGSGIQMRDKFLIKRKQMIAESSEA